MKKSKSLSITPGNLAVLKLLAEKMECSVPDALREALWLLCEKEAPDLRLSWNICAASRHGGRPHVETYINDQLVA